MTFILDTHILLCALGEPEKLSGSQRETIESPRNRPLVSSIAITEMYSTLKN